MALVGVISDTHGLLRPEALMSLRGCDLVLHAGDVGDPRILADLREIAPLRVVRGNIDHGTWAQALPATEVVEVEGHAIYMLHDIEDLDLDPEVAGIAAVIFGHSHRPWIERRGAVLFVNPGSAGPRRFHLPVTVALLRVGPEALEAELVELDVSGQPRRRL
jgi:putative phosphoesterase